MRAKRVDANQRDVVLTLRRAGAHVAITSALGLGFPDLCVLFRGRVWLLELKDGAKSPSQQALTPAEAEFHARWACDSVRIVRSPREALEAIGAASA